MQQIRQGDVLIVPVEQVPATAKPKPTQDRVVLAYGEVTGHHHSFDASAGGVALLEVPGAVVEEVYVTVDRLSALEHQEHGTVLVEPGVGRVIRQRQYAPAEIRSVAD